MTTQVVAVHPLDNPAWHALTGPHAALADGRGAARRYARDTSFFAAVERLDGPGWDALAALAGPGGRLIVARADVPSPPGGWHELRRIRGHQMTLTPPLPDGDPGRSSTAVPDLRPLGPDDVPAMLDLVGVAQPGPFLPGTVGLGGYVGVFEGGRLVAMAGRRLALPGHVEVSAVCTHPDATGRGLGTAVTAAVVEGIVADQATPFLHVTVGNDRARRVYERLGFRIRTTIDFVALAAPG